MLDVFFVVSIESFPALKLYSTVLEVSVNEWGCNFGKSGFENVSFRTSGGVGVRVLDIVAMMD